MKDRYIKEAKTQKGQTNTFVYTRKAKKSVHRNRVQRKVFLNRANLKGKGKESNKDEGNVKHQNEDRTLS